MKIALGCGDRNYGEDWIHIDGSGKEQGGNSNFKSATNNFDANTHKLSY